MALASRTNEPMSPQANEPMNTNERIHRCIRKPSCLGSFAARVSWIANCKLKLWCANCKLRIAIAKSQHASGHTSTLHQTSGRISAHHYAQARIITQEYIFEYICTPNTSVTSAQISEHRYITTQQNWFIDRLLDWLIDWLIGWLIDWLTWLVDWLIDWLIDSLIDWLTD